MTSPGGVREYNRIRRYLEHIYLYGFFSREDFAQAKIGGVKDYDYGMKLLRSLYPETEDAAVWKDGRKYLRIQRDYTRSGEDRMADSYLLCSMDVEDELPALLGVLSSLTEGAKTVQEVCRDTAIRTQVKNELNYHTVRRWLLDLAEYGYVERRGRGYALGENFLAELSDTAALQLYDYVRFASGTTYPRVAGTFLRRTLERELQRRGLSLAAEAPYLLRHSVSRNVFDEELLYQLMEAMEERRMTVLKLGQEELVVQPAALRVDGRLGRWYLLAREKGPMLLRVSAVQEVRLGRELSPEEWDRGREACLAAFAQSGCSGALPSSSPALLRAELHFEKAPGLENQFVRELRMGQVVRRGERREYQVQINDPVEWIPFLREYAPWLKLEPGEHGLDERIREDLLQMRAQLRKEAPQ